MGEWMDEITLRMKDFLGLYIPSNDQINEPAINQIQSASPTIRTVVGQQIKS